MSDTENEDANALLIAHASGRCPNCSSTLEVSHSYDEIEHRAARTWRCACGYVRTCKRLPFSHWPMSHQQEWEERAVRMIREQVRAPCVQCGHKRQSAWSVVWNRAGWFFMGASLTFYILNHCGSHADESRTRGNAASERK